MICGTSSEENSRIFWKTIGTKSQKTPTTTTQIASSVHKAANERGNRVRPDMQPRKQVGQRLADNRQNGRHQNIGDHVAEIPHQKENHCRDSACNEISV